MTYCSYLYKYLDSVFGLWSVTLPGRGSRIIDSPDCLLLFTVLTVVITVLEWTTEALTYISCIPFYIQCRAQLLGEWGKDWDSLFAQTNCRWRWHFCGEKQMERETKKKRASQCLCVQKKKREREKGCICACICPYLCGWLCIRAVKQLVLGFRLSELKVIPLQLTCLSISSLIRQQSTCCKFLSFFSFFLTFIIFVCVPFWSLTLHPWPAWCQAESDTISSEIQLTLCLSISGSLLLSFSQSLSPLLNLKG